MVTPQLILQSSVPVLDVPYSLHCDFPFAPNIHEWFSSHKKDLLQITERRLQQATFSNEDSQNIEIEKQQTVAEMLRKTVRNHEQFSELLGDLSPNFVRRSANRFENLKLTVWLLDMPVI